MTRPTPARLADLQAHRRVALPELVFRRRPPAPGPGSAARQDCPATSTRSGPPAIADDVARVVEVAERFGWSANWTRDVSRGGLAWSA